MKKLTICLLMALLAGFFAETSAQKLSEIPGSFVDVGFGTRPVGMGFAFVGLADDENSTYWNPAGLSQLGIYKAGFSQIDQLGLITYNYATALIPLEIISGEGAPIEGQSMGIAVISSGDEAMKELSVHVAYGIRFKKISAGLSLKYRNASFGGNTLNRDDYRVFDDEEITIGFGQQVYGDANGFGVDIGLMVHATEKLQFGAVLRDFYAPMTWNSQARSSENQARGTYDEGLPKELVVGSALKFSKNFTAVVDVQPALSEERTNWVRTGVEARLVNILLLRAGTEQGINDLDDEKFTLGTGLDIGVKDKVRLQADFGYVIDPIQNSTRFSFSVSF